MKITNHTQDMINMLASVDSILSFQTFDDSKRNRKNLTRQFHGMHADFTDSLQELNEQGAGIFLTINQTDGKGRKASNITSIRALFVDFDTPDNERVERLRDLNLPPSMIIESSKDKHHAYWLVDGVEVNQFSHWQQKLITYFSITGDIPDKSVHDLSRVMRLPGYVHQKGQPFMTRMVHIGKKYELQTIESWIESITQAGNSVDHNSISSSNLLPQLTAEQVRSFARGRWVEILSRLNLIVSNNPKQHTACPVCGGKDRFRFDNYNGTGSYICSQGDGNTIAGDGLSLLIDHAKMDFNQAISAVTQILYEMKLISIHDDKSKHINTEWDDPQSLDTPPNEPTPYPIDAWEGHLREVVEKIAYYAQVPLAMAGQCVLGAMSHIGQIFIDAPMGHSYKPTSLILITEGGSGSGKSSAMKLSNYQISQYEQEQYEQYKFLLLSWQNERDEKSGQEKKAFLATNPCPDNPMTIFEDVTIESLLDKFIEDEIVNASWSTDEAGQFFKGFSMNSDTVGSALSAITKLYDSGNVNRTRSKKSQFATFNTSAYDVRLTMFLMGQHVVLKEALSSDLFNGQGFLARALIACPESLQGKRIWNDEQRRSQSPYEDPVLIDYWKLCEDLLENKRPENPKKRQKISWQDKDVEQSFYEGMQIIENRQAKGQVYEYLKQYASRMAENASRIASLMAFFDNRLYISNDDIQRAFKLVEYSINERLRYHENTPVGQENNSQKFSKWLVKKVKNMNPPKLNRTYLANSSPNPMRKSTKILQAELDKLESAGHIRQEVEGRKKVVYINPKLLL